MNFSNAKIKIAFYLQFVFEYIVLINKYSRKFINIYLEKHKKYGFLSVLFKRKVFLCKMVYAIKFVGKKH